MKQALVNPTAMPHLRCWSAAFCLLTGMLLAACGGQGGASTGAPSATSATSAPAAQAQPGASGNTATVMAGAYGLTQTNQGTDFVSFVWALNGVTHWMALYMPTPNTASYPPVLYRAVLSLQTQGAASVVLTSFDKQYQLRAGTAAVTAASSDGYQMALKGVDLSDAGGGIQLTAASLTTSSDINRDWTGTWADAGPGGSIKTSAKLSLQNGTANSGFGNCTDMRLALTSAPDASAQPYFLAVMTINPTTGCARTPNASASTTLSGVAFIHNAVVGSTPVKRLELMLTDASGSGVSFRADQ
jgi:hypothetical protein